MLIRYIAKAACVFTLFEPALFGQQALAEQMNLPTRFRDWCLQRNAFSKSTQLTINDLMLEALYHASPEAKRKFDCDKAEAILSKQKIFSITLSGDLQPLSSLTQIEQLMLDFSYSSAAGDDITPLAALKKLKSLWYKAPHRIVDWRGINVQPLASLKNLTSLTFEGRIKNPASIGSSIGKLQRLTNLELIGTGIEDYNFLANLPELVHLELSGNAISDVRPLANLSQLKYLDLSGNSINDIRPLMKLNQLSYLDLRQQNIRTIQPLINLKRLTSVFLSGNPIRDVQLVSQLKSLKVLDLANLGIQDVSFLSNSTNLEQLNLMSNKIQDVRPLTSLKQLETLDLRGNPVADLSPLRSLPRLNNLQTGALEPSQLRCPKNSRC